MGNPVSVERFVHEVKAMYGHTPRITYSDSGGSAAPESDCRGVILGSIRAAGYKDFRFSGTNDFLNNCCKWTGTPEEAKRLGYDKHEGLICFNVGEDGRSTHMGVKVKRMPCLYPDIEGRESGDVINSSKSKNGMILSDSERQNGWWNVCALAKEHIIDYSAWGIDTPPQETDEPQGAEELPLPRHGAPPEGVAFVIAKDLRLRNSMTTKDKRNVICAMNETRGRNTSALLTDIEVFEGRRSGDGDPWVRGLYEDGYGTMHRGYAKITDGVTVFLQMPEGYDSVD